VDVDVDVVARDWTPSLLRNPLHALKKYSYLSRSQIPEQVTPEENGYILNYNELSDE